VFIVRKDGKDSLHYGLEQIIAASQLGRSQIEALVFKATNDREADQIGEAAFYALSLADEIAEDAPGREGHGPRERGSKVALLPGMSAADKKRVAARVLKAGLEND
jgi:hypothetical protein